MPTTVIQVKEGDVLHLKVNTPEALVAIQKLIETEEGLELIDDLDDDYITDKEIKELEARAKYSDEHPETLIPHEEAMKGYRARFGKTDDNE